jgi:hypothetical protein
MWNKLAGLFGSGGAESGGKGRVRSLRHHIKPSGRVPYPLLLELAESNELKTFIELVGYPMLVGSAIKKGTVEAAEKFDSRQKRRKTHLFRPADILARSGIESDSLQQALYLLAKAEGGSNNNFTVGRVAGNDLVMPDFAVSERHAVIHATGNAYYIADLGSTNGTRVNGASIGMQRVALNDGDIITFARYDFEFLFPKSLYSLLRAKIG